MRCTFKTVFYVNGSKERNGIVPIMGRVTINGTIAQFSCKQSVTKTIWDAKGNRAIGKSKEAKEVNFALDNIKAQIAKHYQRLSDREAFVTAEMVRNAYQGIGTEYETLLRAFDKENEAFAKRVGKDRSKRTYLKYLTVRKDAHLFNVGSLDMINKRIKRVAKMCGIKKRISFHVSRHSFAVLALNYGMPIESVSKILGHTNISVVRTIYKEGMFRMSDVQQKQETSNGVWQTLYDFPMIVAICFRLSTDGAAQLRDVFCKMLYGAKEKNCTFIIQFYGSKNAFC